MRILVTGSSGHLGEALVRTLSAEGRDVVGLDIAPSPFTHAVGSIADRAFVHAHMHGVEAVLHTATLHKPHVATHSRQDFVDTNITGTLNLLEESVAAGVRSFVFTSTTSVFGDALVPPAGMPAAWITEDVEPIAKNIYGVTKLAAENLCHLFHRNQKLPCIILRTSRFFPEQDDDAETRGQYTDENIKLNEYPYRRVALEDVVEAHRLAIEHAPGIGFDRFIISATTPFVPGDLAQLRNDAPAVLAKHVPGYAEVYTARDWRMFPGIDRVYVNSHARQMLGWRPAFDFAHILERLRAGECIAGPLASIVGSKGYHVDKFDEGPYPV
ncbi:MAG: NAD(P)-dependent oxidoreductase [Betaproteobacteria bacterium]|nr:NAD(P)-dependent oxidoreductase [Betaproteobacteria bacterium]